jgi:hypothetical protein
MFVAPFSAVDGFMLGASWSDPAHAAEFSKLGSQRIRRVLNTCLYLGFRAFLADRAEAKIR